MVSFAAYLRAMEFDIMGFNRVTKAMLPASKCLCRMTRSEYLAALSALQLKPAATSTAAALGLSVRQLQRIAAGKAPVPKTLELLLNNMICGQISALRNFQTSPAGTIPQ